ncbi:MAG: DeoR/GlpR family DNA-binding transcription regulator [Desertimonas sp.]
MQYARHQTVVRRLREDGPLSVAELCAVTRVSPATMRRDLDRLETDGLIERVRGGAVLRPDVAVDADARQPFADVVTTNYRQKTAIAKRAAELVDDDGVVLVDIGTTTMLVAQQLRGRPVTLVTASLAVLDVARDDSALRVIVLGGQLRRSYHSLVGSLTEDALRNVQASIAFLGASGVRANGTVLDNTAVEVPIKRALLDAADRSVLVADGHKFPGTGALRVCEIDAFDTLITDDGADAPAIAEAERRGVEVLMA